MRLNELFEADIKDVNTPLPNGLGKYKKIVAAYLKKPDEYIYRGIRTSQDFFIGDGSKMNRESANTFSYINTIVDVMPEWQAFPKRSKSFICATSINKAANYGTVYLVIPLENQEIGVCPRKDFFYGFDADEDNNVRKLNHLIGDMWAFYKDPSGVKYTVDDAPQNLRPSELRVIFEHFDELKEDIEENLNAEYFTHTYGKFGTELLDYYGRTVDFFRGKLNPDENGFKVVKHISNKQFPDNEVWMSGKVLFIDADWVKDNREIFQ